MEIEDLCESVFEEGEGEVIADEDEEPSPGCIVVLAGCFFEDGPGDGADGGDEEDESEHEVVVGCISAAIGEMGDGIGEVEDGAADPGDENMEGLDIPVVEIVDFGEEAVGVKDDVQGIENETETQEQALAGCEIHRSRFAGE